MDCEPRHLGAVAVVGFLAAAGCTGQNPDYSEYACEVGRGQCIESRDHRTFPVVCGPDQNGRPMLLSARCPALAGCQNGLCVPAQGQRACMRQRECGDGEFCVPLVSGATLSGFCVRATSGTLAPGAVCQRDDDCQSFLCLQHSKRKYCLNACQTGQDCRIPDRCLPFNVTVTGVQGTIQSCSAE